MAEWYYSLGSQQKGPIAWDALRQLAASGKLQRTDMVWREGMVDWKPASQVEGLFTKAEATAVRQRTAADTGTARREVASDKGEDSATTRRREVSKEEEDDDLDEDRPRRKKKRKKTMSPGALAGIIGGSVAGGILILILVIVLLVRSGRGGNNPAQAAQGGGAAVAAGPQIATYTITLREDQDNTRMFTFQQGQRVEITVRTPGGIFQNPDVDLIITRTGDPGFFLSDEAISKDCYLQFVAPATDQYMVQIDNLGPGSATSTVTVR